MKQIATEIQIDASADQVWAVLTDFARFGEWNPFITSIEGNPQTGQRLKASIRPPDSKPMTFRPLVLSAEPGRELRWVGHFLVPGLFDGEHLFRIEPIAPGTVRFRQSEQFRGLLVPVLWGMMREKTRRGFEAMNAALKQVAEAAS